MRTKGLLLGALPVPQEGPWVRTGGEGQWEIETAHDYEDAIIIEVYPPEAAQILRDIIDAESTEKVRAVIVRELHHVPFVSVEMTRVA